MRATATKNSDGPVGLYYPEDVKRYVEVSDLPARDHDVSLSPMQISGWARRGFYGRLVNQFDRDRIFIEFPHLITIRMIAILLSYKIGISKIAEAHAYVRKTTGDPYPFATRPFWTDASIHPSHIYTKIDELLLAANLRGQMPFQELLMPKIVKVANMKFGDADTAVSWEPRKGILLDPKVVSGQPCIKGTRIPTALIKGQVEAGDSAEFVAQWHDLSDTQVESALSWESDLDAVQRANSA